MLVHTFDSSLSEAEWRDWVMNGPKFGLLAIAGANASQAPDLIPTHFTLREDEIWLHLARENRASAALRAGNAASLSIFGDYAYVPNQWRARPDTPAETGVPTSYYAAVNFVLEPTVVDSPVELVEILEAQMQDMQPEGGYAAITADGGAYSHMLSAIFGVKFAIKSVEAKFKYDDHKSTDFRQRIAERLFNRNSHSDAGAATQQQRRLDEIGDWSSR
ncbi:MAG: FMN-binding negative transcriptional regulator [Actinomycetales bacterium]|nr:FMN-binding negative transcriptional regulator [Actinomycetales bacterium]